MITLSHADLTVRMDEPGGLYRGSRFDHAGYIYSAVYKGVEFCAKEFPDLPAGTGGAGLCSEFGIFRPPGFEEAQTGDWFWKPGVGALRKRSDRYVFYEPHECRFDSFRMEEGEQSIRTISDGSPVNGYRMRLERTISLTDDGVMIHYALENRGIKAIHTEEYVHNFISIGGTAIGPGYSFAAVGAAVFERLPSFLSEADGRIVFRSRPEEPFYCRARGTEATEGGFRMDIRLEGAGCFQEQDDFSPSLAAVWGCSHALSVESFRNIDLMPGERLSYMREFKLSLFERGNGRR